MTTVIVAKNVGFCAMCNKEYAIGTRIAKDSKTGKWVMADCLWPSKSHAPSNPASGVKGDGGAPSSHTSAFNPQEGADVFKIVEQRLSDAKVIIKRQAPEADQYSDYWNLLTEVLKQLQSEAWLQIEKRKRI